MRKKLSSALLMCVIAFLSTLLSSQAYSQAEVTFGTPINLGPMINSPEQEGSPEISTDGLELYFNSNRPGGEGGADIWVSTRKTTDDEWGEAVNLGPVVNSAANEVAPSISADGLSLYFCDWGAPRPGGFGETDLWITTRATKDDPWGEPVNLGPTVNSADHEVTPEISFNDLELYYEADFPGGVGTHDLWVTTRATKDGEWGKPVNPGPAINKAGWEHCPTISSDGLTLFYDSQIPDGEGSDLMVTRRPTLDSQWAQAVNLGHTYSSHYASDLSADGAMLYFASNHPGGSGGSDIWQIPILSMDSVDTAFKATVEEIFATWRASNLDGDFDLWLSLWDENAVKMASNRSTISGKSAIGKMKRKMSQARVVKSWDVKIDEVQPAGDFGYARGTYIINGQSRADSRSSVLEGTFLTVFKKQADGSWKIYRDCMMAK